MPDPRLDPLTESRLFDWPTDKPIHEAIGEALGAASMCWQYPERAGLFEPETALRIADELIDLLQRKLWVDA